MPLYGAIDLHSNNSFVGVYGEDDRARYERSLPNDLELIKRALEPHRDDLCGVVVESTFNWYWLVDGLMDAGLRVHLANTTAIQQYSGLKFGDDRSDTRWLAKMLRLGLLPEGHIYPKAERPIRDLLRKRSQLVRQRTTHVLSIQNLVHRNTGVRLSGNQIKAITDDRVPVLVGEADLCLALQANLEVLRCLEGQVQVLEKTILRRVRLRPGFRLLKTVAGIGPILALTILLETGDIRRFSSVGRFSSYCRCVGSKRLSNGKIKGQGNKKNGNKYLAWAFVEAANFAIRYYPPIRQYYQRKRNRTNGVVAIKTVAHKLARASYYVLRDEVPFDMVKVFG